MATSITGLPSANFGTAFGPSSGSGPHPVARLQSPVAAISKISRRVVIAECSGSVAAIISRCDEPGIGR